MIDNPMILTQTGLIDSTQLYYPYEERGLQFGDGVYEVIRVYYGECYLLSKHIDRLFRSAEAIKLTLPFTKEQMRIELKQLVEVNHLNTNGKIYLQVTRGSAKRNHIFPAVEANFYAYVEELERPIEKLKLGVKAITLPDMRWQNCYIKSLNLLPNVMAKQEAFENGCFEAILHRDRIVTECSSSNVYLVKNNVIYTHPETHHILHGCVRDRIKTLIDALDMELNETAFATDNIPYADEVFITSSTAEVMPIVEVDQIEIGNGQPGLLTQALQEAYQLEAGLISSPLK
ncbi:D-amino-acid transaminase [Paraliobacillus sediminis]|uniref:D-amino-acid transaminase n=1 Tax=Paraliobacillus sediminis TaxID=1885916 RepID=UPI001F075ED1|nr:D-amino-acid transaminase [Paraliobacillus sediminis]